MNLKRLFTLLALVPGLVFAQNWPAHPITIVMGFPAGSGVDVVARLLQAGRVRLLGVTTAKRVPSVPDIPTIAESGVPGYESYIWFGLFGAERPRRADREPRQRCGEGGSRDAGGAREAEPARQHAALGIARAVPADGEDRPREMGSGG